MLALQALINGLAIGASYALLGLPVVLIYRSTRVANFAIGGLVVWTGLIGSTLARDLSLWIAYPLLLLLATLGSVLLYAVCMRFALGKTEVLGVMVSLAVGFALEGLAAVLYGSDVRGLPRVFPFRSFTLVEGRLSLPSDVLVALGAVAIVFAGLLFALTRTQFGRELRAISDDAATAKTLGIDVDKVMLRAYALLGVCVFAATLVVIPGQGVNAFQGLPLLIGTMIGVSIGGLERVEGAVIGGLLAGLITSVGITLFNAFYQAIALALLLILVLALRPEGLFTGLRGRDVA